MACHFLSLKCEEWCKFRVGTTVYMGHNYELKGVNSGLYWMTLVRLKWGLYEMSFFSSKYSQYFSVACLKK